jgi:methylglyoxal/glyoxal reductase
MGDTIELTLGSTITLNNKTKMPRLGFGVYGIPTGEATVQAVSWALQAGYRHIDTAKFYRNETAVGKAIAQSGIDRSTIWVTTKLFPTDYLRVEKAFETSLRKLNLDYIDLYLVHFPIPGLEKRVWRRLEAIYKTGKVRAIGVSNYNATQLQATLDFATIAPSVDQMRCSVFGYNKRVYELCQSQGIAFEAYSPLTRGKRLNDVVISKLAEKNQKTAAQILLRWALQKNMIIIPKSQHKERITQNANIFEFNINEADMKILDALSN